MTRTDPPVVATWILEHLTPGHRNDALSGDLLEEFRSGRSVSWYWRQVLAAIAIASFRELRTHTLLLTFAALWAILAPAWWLFALWFAAHSLGFMLPWPYPAMLGTLISVLFSFWAGLAAYVLLYGLIGRNFSLKKGVRGFWIGPLLFIMLIVPIRLFAHPLGITLSSEAELRLFAYFVSLVAAAWGVEARGAPESKATAS